VGRMTGKKVIISGATGGVGSAASRRLCAEGATVLGLDISEAGAQELEEEIREAGGAFSFRTADVGSAESVNAMAEHVRETWGTVDALVNNAGIILGAPLLETTDEQWDRLHTVNLKSVFLMTRAIAPLMGPGGSIVNMSSTGGLVAFADMAAYGAAKAGVAMFSKCCALDLAPDIRVNAILPGVIDTQMPRNFVSTLDGPEEIWAGFERGHLLGRLAKPEELASAIFFLASEESSFMTGANMVVDGGWTVP
jgi:2-keto-3-deoxy-L-fuconate dehydrogenase